MEEQEKQRILRERARELAHEHKKKDTSHGYLRVLEFLLAYEKYAIETAHVREVYPLKDLTPLPCTPPYVLGIINVRGQILSVIELKKFFELPEKGISNLNKVIIISTNKTVFRGVEGMEFGIVADAVFGVRSIPLNEVQPSLPTLTGIREDYLKGITIDRTVILDAMKILSDKRIVVNEQVD